MQIIETNEIISTTTNLLPVFLIVGVFLLIFFIFGTALGLALSKDIEKKVRIQGRVLAILGILSGVILIGFTTYYSNTDNTITQYTAIVEDYDSIEENNYIVIEHVKDKTYQLIKN